MGCCLFLLLCWKCLDLCVCVCVCVCVLDVRLMSVASLETIFSHSIGCVSFYEFLCCAKAYGLD